MSNLEYQLGEDNQFWLGSRRFWVSFNDDGSLYLHKQINARDLMRGEINGQEIVGSGKMNIVQNQSWSFEDKKRQVGNSYLIHIYGSDDRFGPIPVDVAESFADLLIQHLGNYDIRLKVIRPNVSNGHYNPFWEKLGYHQEKQKEKMLKSLNGNQ